MQEKGDTLSTGPTIRNISWVHETELTLECTIIAASNVVPDGIIAPGELMVISTVLLDPFCSVPVDP